MNAVTETDPESLNPIDVEKRIIGLVKTLSEALGGWKGLYKAHEDAKHAYDQAYAVARKAAADAGITANDRKYHADLDPAVIAARNTVIDADVLFKYCDERLRTVRAALSAMQSVGRSIQTAYQNAGRGDF